MVPTDALPAAEFLIRHLYRSIDVAQGKKFFAITESETPGGDDWYWNDDNAKSLEFLSRPEALDHSLLYQYWRRDPTSRRPFVLGREARARKDQHGRRFILFD
jgi:hypothetical protein